MYQVLGIVGSLKASLSFGRVIGTASTDLSLLPVIRETAPLVEGNQHHKSLRSAGFCPESGQMEFLLDLISAMFCVCVGPCGKQASSVHVCYPVPEGQLVY